MIACAIKFDTSKRLLNACKILQKKGFVFTSARYKTPVEQHYPSESKRWRYIYVGHTSDPNGCKMIMNTATREDSWYTIKRGISFREFVTEILPTW